MTPAESKRRPIVSPEDQSATFIELFFDLVFVFAVTQIVGILHDGLNGTTITQSVLVFWIVWWAWTQFTWALNAADTTHPAVEFFTLLATSVAFFMAIALPDAFGERSAWFASAYVLVRMIGLTLYVWVTWHDREQATGTIGFGLVSLTGMAAVLAGGLLGGGALYALWGAAILLDLLAANFGGRTDSWNIHPDHFAERHGLFMIIALGEALIVAASGATRMTWDGNLIAVALLAVGATCGLWWTYFARVKPVLEHTLTASSGLMQGRLARDAYSLLHFVVLCGVIAFAFAIEEAIAHPADPLPVAARLALALGLALFLGGVAAAMWRVTHRILVGRLIGIVAIGIAVLAVPGVAPWITVGIAFVGIVLLAVYEQLFDRSLLAEA